MDADALSRMLSEQQGQVPENLHHYFYTFEDYWERKLWHELTDVLMDFFQHQESAPTRLPLYNVFIKGFADKINQLKLVTLGLSTASQCKGMPFNPSPNPISCSPLDRRQRTPLLPHYSRQQG